MLLTPANMHILGNYLSLGFNSNIYASANITFSKGENGFEFFIFIYRT